MPYSRQDDSLRKLLYTDAFTCLASGMLMAFLSGPLASLTGIPIGLLTYAGLSLFPIAAFMTFVGVRARERIPGVWLVVAGNAAWVLGSLWLLLASDIEVSSFGQLFVAAQAAVVALLTVLEARSATRPLARVHAVPYLPPGGVVPPRENASA